MRIDDTANILHPKLLVHIAKSSRTLAICTDRIRVTCDNENMLFFGNLLKILFLIKLIQPLEELVEETERIPVTAVRVIDISFHILLIETKPIKICLSILDRLCISADRNTR